MVFKLNTPINKNNLNFFIILSVFIFFLIFILSKGFIKNEEISDILFLISSLILIEISYLFISNKKIFYKTLNYKDNLNLLLIFCFIFVIWNNEIIYDYSNLILFFFFKLFLVILILNFFKINNYFKAQSTQDNILQIVILSISLSGIFYQINYTSLSFFVIIIFLSILLLIINFIFFKINIVFDYIFALIIFLIALKVFILTSEKDSFHYSWFLGPINSLSEQYKLLDNVASQYGFLNILLVYKLTKIVNLSSEYIFVSLIVIFFIIFFLIFIVIIRQNIKLPLTLFVTFLSFLIFGNIGYLNLSGAMFIPSSSVYRFLPSLLTIIFFSNFIKNKIKINLNFTIFLISFLISILWSFESAVFVLIPILLFLILKFFFNLFKVKNKKKFYFKKIYFFKLQIFLSILAILFIFYFILSNNFSLFYEHALNTKGSLSEEITNNKITLIFLVFILIAYLILRDSFVDENLFFKNSLWFGLLISYSSYFIVRSVDSNFLNIFPFFTFIICSMKPNSSVIKDLRIKFIYILIYFTIISSIFSLILSKDKFLNILTSPKFLNPPEYLSKNYLPSEEIMKIIRKNSETPLTLVSGNTIHQKNSNFLSNGYGLPILPLEHFNILKNSIKQNLFDKYFSEKGEHLILCIYDCKFYQFDNESDIRSKIFLGKNVNLIILRKIETGEISETLFLLVKK